MTGTRRDSGTARPPSSRRREELRAREPSGPSRRLGRPWRPERAYADGHGNGPAPPAPLAPPQNLEAEQSVLGAVLLSDTALPALIIDERLKPEDFYREAHGVIFAAMLELYTRRRAGRRAHARRAPQAGRELEPGGAAASTLLAARVPAVGHVRQYARIVRENAMLRRLLRAAYEIQAASTRHEAQPRELVDSAERAILEVAHEDRRKDFRAIDDVLDAELDKLEKLSHEGTAITGTPSGFEDLDTITGGFQPGNLIILAARPSMGKSRADGQLRRERRARARSKAVALFSLEMSESRARAALHRLAGVDQGRRPAQGQGAASPLGQDHGGLEPARRSRRCSSTTRPTCRCSTCARRRGACASSTRTGSG